MSQNEYFSFLAFQWDVGKARELVKGRKPNSEIPDTEVFYHTWLEGYDQPLRIPLINIDIEYAMSDAVDTSVPLIAVIIPDDDGAATSNGVLIDGWHRAYKAYHTGVKKLDMHVLTPEEEVECRIQGVLPHESKQSRQKRLQELLDWVSDEAPSYFPNFVRAAKDLNLKVSIVLEDYMEWPNDDNIMLILEQDEMERTGSGFYVGKWAEELIRYYR